MTWRRSQIQSWLKNTAQDRFQHNIERTIAKLLEERFGPLAEQPIGDVIELGRQ